MDYTQYEASRPGLCALYIRLTSAKVGMRNGSATIISRRFLQSRKRTNLAPNSTLEQCKHRRTIGIELLLVSCSYELKDRKLLHLVVWKSSFDGQGFKAFVTEALPGKNVIFEGFAKRAYRGKMYYHSTERSMVMLKQNFPSLAGCVGSRPQSTTAIEIRR